VGTSCWPEENRFSNGIFGFHSRQSRTQAKMNSFAKGQMGVGITSTHNKLISLLNNCLIAVCRVL
jgi:hypothetical protein